MNQKPTSNHCAIFGHNYVRNTDVLKSQDLAQCKHCNHQVKITTSGDIESKDERSEIYQVMQHLFLLKRSHKRIQKNLQLS